MRASAAGSGGHVLLSCVMQPRRTLLTPHAHRQPGPPCAATHSCFRNPAALPHPSCLPARLRLPACVFPPASARLRLPACICVRLPPAARRELTLPIAAYLGIPKENVFANRMNWQWDDETGMPTKLVSRLGGPGGAGSAGGVLGAGACGCGLCARV